MNTHDIGIGWPDLAGFAALLADGTRASFCMALLDGRAWTAAELARHSGVAASTATEHLNHLVAGGLLEEERRGRYRYVRLADARTAELIENLASMAPRRARPAPSLGAASRGRALARARTCYDYLAGALGVAITQAMTERGLLAWEQGLTLTAEGPPGWPDWASRCRPPGVRRSAPAWIGPNAARTWPEPSAPPYAPARSAPAGLRGSASAALSP
jgi:DNA-binding transcriptional ArsR family regulator